MNNKDPHGIKSAIFSALAVLAVIVVTILFTSFKDSSETADTQSSEYATVSGADMPNLSANNSEVKNHYQHSKAPQNANVAVGENMRRIKQEGDIIERFNTWKPF